MPEQEYMLEEMPALIDGQQGWHVYRRDPPDELAIELEEEFSYTHVGYAKGFNRDEALKNFLSEGMAANI